MAQASTANDDVEIDAMTNAESAYREGASFATVLMMVTPDDLRPTTVRAQYCTSGHPMIYEDDEPIDQHCPICGAEFTSGLVQSVYPEWVEDFRRDLRRALDFFRDG